MKHQILLLLLLPLVINQQSFAASFAPHSSGNTLLSQLNAKDLQCEWQQERCPLSSLTQRADKGKGISEKKAASIAKKAFGGKVIKVSRKGRIYRVKLLKSGIVRIVKIDAATGSIL